MVENSEKWWETFQEDESVVQFKAVFSVFEEERKILLERKKDIVREKER